LSRHRKIRLSRSKAIVIAAAGTLSVATGASATAATAGAPRLAVADRLARPVAEPEDQQGNAALAHYAFQLRLTQTRDAIAQRQAARKRAPNWSPARPFPPRPDPRGPDWQTSAATQITWGLRYIRDTYGSPCAAWSHEQAAGWY
jgi:hypothetical protein